MVIVQGPETNSSNTVFVDPGLFTDMILAALSKYNIIPSQRSIDDIYDNLELSSDIEHPFNYGMNWHLGHNIASLLTDSGHDCMEKDVIKYLNGHKDKKIHNMIGDIIDVILNAPISIVYDNDPIFTYNVFCVMSNNNTIKHFKHFMQRRIDDMKWNGDTYFCPYIPIDYHYNVMIGYAFRDTEDGYGWYFPGEEWKYYMKFCEEKREERNASRKKISRV